MFLVKMSANMRAARFWLLFVMCASIQANIQAASTGCPTAGTPVIATIVPSTCPVVGTCSIIIQSTGTSQFTGSGQIASITFGGINQPTFTMTNLTTVVIIAAAVTSPSGGNVVITSDCGQITLVDNSLQPLRFAYVETVISSAYPPAGPQAGGQVITISGQGMTNDKLNDIQSVALDCAPYTFETALLSASQTSLVIQVKTSQPTTASAQDCNIALTASSVGTLYSAATLYIMNPAGTISMSSPEPDIGSIYGGTLVTVSGTNLGNGSDVTAVSLCGELVQRLVSQSRSEVAIVTPSVGSSCVIEVSSVSFGTTVSANPFRYDITATGTLSSIQPSVIGLYQGGLVTISGSDLCEQPQCADVTQVTICNNVFNTMPVVVAASSTGSNVIVSLPAQGNLTTGRDCTVSVSNYLWGTSQAVLPNFAIVAGNITSITPAISNYDGVTEITIVGTYLSLNNDVQYVSFGPAQTQVTSFISQTTTMIVLNTPSLSYAGAVTVQLFSPSTGFTTTSSLFSYDVLHLISFLVPANGPVAGGQTVTVLGQNLIRDAAIVPTVMFGSNPAAVLLQQMTATQLVVTAPSGYQQNAVLVAVSSIGFAVFSSGQYTYNNPGLITTITPSTGPTAGGTIVTISSSSLSPIGTGSDITTVFFGSVNAVIQSQTSTSVVVMTPAQPIGGQILTPVIYSTSYGIANTSVVAPFTYTQAAAETLWPSLIPVNTLVTVTLVGSNLCAPVCDVQNVWFANVAATVVSQSVSQLVVTVQAPASFQIMVSSVVMYSPTLRDNVTWANAVTWLGPRVCNVLTPNNGPQYQAFTITVGGSSLGNGTDVTAVTLAGLSGVITQQTINQLSVEFAPFVNSGTALYYTANVMVYGSFGPLNCTMGYVVNPVSSIGPVTPAAIPVSTNGVVVITITAATSLQPLGAGGSDITQVLFGTKTARLMTQTALSVVVNMTAPFVAGAVNVNVLSVRFGSATRIGAFTVNGPNVITSITPAIGPRSGLNILTITGTPLGSGSDVTSVVIFNSDAVILSQTATQVIVNTTAFNTGNQFVNVVLWSVSFGRADLVNGYYITYPGTIVSAVPNVGPMAGLTTVTIVAQSPIGNGSDITAVYFNSLPAVSILSQTSVTVTVRTPTVTVSQQVNLYTESVAYGRAILLNGFTYLTPPGILTVSPDGGPNAGGRLVTILGTDLGNGSDVYRVQIGAETIIVAQTTTRIVVQTVAVVGSGGKSVEVFSLSRGSAIAGANYFMYLPGNITAIQPSSCPNSGGRRITIYGTNLAASLFDISILSLAGVSGNSIFIANASLIVLQCAPSSSTTAVVTGVVVLNSLQYGVTTSVSSFTFNAPLVLGSIVPTGGPLHGGNTITITTANAAPLYLPGDAYSASICGYAAYGFISNVNVPNIISFMVNASTNTVVQGCPVVWWSTSFGTAESQQLYTFNPLPIITSLFPQTLAPINMYTFLQLTITGENLYNGSALDINVVNVFVDPADIITTTPTLIVFTLPYADTIATGNIDVYSDTYGMASVGTFSWVAQSMLRDAIPNKGNAATNMTITLSGTSLTNGTETPVVTNASGAPFPVLSSNSTTVVIQIPAGSYAPGQSVSFQVRSLWWQTTVYYSDLFVFNALASITSVNPTSGRLAGAVRVTISGTKLCVNAQDVVQVKLAGVAVAGVISASANLIIVMSGNASAAVSGNVTVTTVSAGVTVSNVLWSYNNYPVISSITPAVFIPAGSTDLTLSGNNLFCIPYSTLISSTTTTVQICGYIRSIISVTSTNIVVQSPPGIAGSSCAVSLAVEPQCGTVVLNNAVLYNYFGAGSINSFTPSTAIRNTTTMITITGFALGNGSDIQSVTVGGLPVRNIVAQTNNSVVVQLPYGLLDAGVQMVTVQSLANGVTFNANLFSIVPAPQVSLLYPPSIVASNTNNVVTITGSFTTNPLANNSAITTLTLCGVVPIVIQSNATYIAIQMAPFTVTTPLSCSLVIGTESRGLITYPSIFTAYPAVNITSVTPTTRPQNLYGAITITGNFYTDVTVLGVSLCDSDFVGVDSVSTTSIVVNMSPAAVTASLLVPGSSQLCSLTVSTIELGSFAIANATTLLAPGNITSIVPNVGYCSISKTVTITGDYLFAASTNDTVVVIMIITLPQQSYRQPAITKLFNGSSIIATFNSFFLAPAPSTPIAVNIQVQSQTYGLTTSSPGSYQCYPPSAMQFARVPNLNAYLENTIVINGNFITPLVQSYVTVGSEQYKNRLVVQNLTQLVLQTPMLNVPAVVITRPVVVSISIQLVGLTQTIERLVVCSAATPGVVSAVSVEGPATLQTRPISQLQFAANVSTFSCNTSIPLSVFYQWTEVSGNPTSNFPSGSSASTRVLVIPASTFVSGYTYIVQLAASAVPFSAGGAVYAQYTNITVQVVASALLPIIAGGSRSVTSSAVVTLSSAGSSDPDNVSGQTVSYIWQCSSSSANGICPVMGNGLNGAVVTVGPLPVGIYDWTLQMTKGNRIATTNVSIAVQPGNAPTVSVTTPALSINSNQRLVLTGLCSDGNAVLLWSVTPFIDLTNHDVVLTSRTSLTLVIAASVLQPGAQYTFTLSASNADGLGYAQVLLSVNRPPFGGVCVGPENAVATLTAVFTCENWQTTVPPLQYAFSYVMGQDNTTTSASSSQSLTPISVSSASASSLTDLLTSPSATVILPSGNAPDYYLTIFVTITDGLGASTITPLFIQVYPIGLGPRGAVPFVSAAVVSTLASAIASANGQQATQLVSALSQILNNASQVLAGETDVRQSLRLAMLESLSQAANTTALTVNAINQQTAALSAITASPTEVSDTVAQSSVTLVQTLMQQSIAVGVPQQTSNAVAATLGAIVQARVLSVAASALNSSSSSTNGRDTSADAQFTKTVFSALGTLAQGQLASIVCGERPLTAVSNVLKMTSYKQFISETVDNTFVSDNAIKNTTATFAFPPSLLSGYNLTQLGDCVSTRVISFAASPYSWATAATYQPLTSVDSVIVSTADASQTLTIANLPQPISLTFPNVNISSTELPENMTVEVQFFDVANNSWSSAGCNSSYDALTKTVSANCSHLTDFAAFFARARPKIVFINPFVVFGLNLQNSVTLIIVCSVWFLYIIFMIFFCWFDNRRRKHAFDRLLSEQPKFSETQESLIDEWLSTHDIALVPPSQLSDVGPVTPLTGVEEGEYQQVVNPLRRDSQARLLQPSSPASPQAAAAALTVNPLRSLQLSAAQQRQQSKSTVNPLRAKSPTTTTTATTATTTATEWGVCTFCAFSVCGRDSRQART
eukprot:TRINITY_DN2854_c3_g2_i1.p1 TRINITY_DN2854_c3_g2~~TRINITY_DN2854_c3_g2_i1.p1  ORF type:complete len:3278 (-),score=789.36 TRINITY_DN2854_c3_g2_i1:1185-11018(-)